MNTKEIVPKQNKWLAVWMLITSGLMFLVSIMATFSWTTLTYDTTDNSWIINQATGYATSTINTNFWILPAFAIVAVASFVWFLVIRLFKHRKA